MLQERLYGLKNEIKTWGFEQSINNFYIRKRGIYSLKLIQDNK